MIFVFIVSGCVYLIINLIWFIALKKPVKIKNKSKKKIALQISIIVASKNEEQNIQRLVRSIYANEYDLNNFEVIIVDDQSNDNTPELVKKLQSEFKNLHLISSANKIYPGKKGALSIGITESKYEYILITDADCVVSKKWIETFAKEFSDGNDFVFGVAPLKKENGFINSLSCFENLRSSILTFAAAKLSLPYSAAARSFGFKKSSFENLEGYSRTTETLSGDDDLLLREAAKANMKIGCIIETEAFVYSETKKSFKEYLIQKSRHTKTSTHYLFKSQLMLGLWHIINLLLLATVFLIPVDSIYILFFLMKLFIDVIVVLSLQKKFGYSFNLVQIILLQPVYEVIIVVNFFSAMLLPDKWE